MSILEAGVGGFSPETSGSGTGSWLWPQQHLPVLCQHDECLGQLCVVLGPPGAAYPLCPANEERYFSL